MVFGRFVRNYARQIPDARCLIHGDRSFTWSAMNREINRVASGLREMGVGRGDRVAIMMRNSPEFLEVNFAAQKLGAVPVPVNYRFAPPEVAYVCKNAEAKVLFSDAEFLDRVPAERIPTVKHYVSFGNGKRPEDFRGYDEVKGSAREPGGEVKETDTALICYTGGTTGFPKGVVLTYRHFLLNLDSFLRAYLQIPPKVGRSAPPEFLRRMDAAFLAVLDGLAKPLTEGPAFQNKTFVFRFASDRVKTISLTHRIVDGKIDFESGEPERFDAAVTWHGEMSTLFAKVVPNLLSPSPLAALRLIALNLKGDFEIEGSKRLGMAFIKQARRALKGRDPQTKMYCTTPLFHMAGYASGPITWVASGNQALVFPTSTGFDPKETLELLQRERFQIAVMVPTMWKRLVEFPDLDQYDTSSLVLGLSGAAVLPADMKRKILQRFPNLLLVDAFGQTEMAPVTAVQVDGVAEEVVDRKVGKPLAGVEVRIVDEGGKTLGPGKVGEILYRAETVMKEYFKDPEKTKEAIRDGWFHSGDLGWMDEEGSLHVVERKKEIINSGGEKIYPFEVEEAIRTHPAVAEVAVIGVPDPQWGEAVRAVVQLKPGASATERELIDWCKGKVADYKKPKSVVFTKEMPTSPVEKVLRGKIRELYGKA